MTSEPPSDESASHRRNKRARTRKRWPWIAALVVVVLLAALVAHVVFRSLWAKDELNAARADVTTVRSALTSGNVAAAQAALPNVQEHTEHAKSLTNDPIYKAVGALPWIGDAPQAVTETTQAIDDLAQNALPPLVEAAGAADPAKLRKPGGSAIDVSALAGAAEPLAQASTAVDRVVSDLETVEPPARPAALATAIADLKDQIGDVQQSVHIAATASRIAPAMLGSNGSRRYALMVQSPAEARGTGGLVGAYAIVEVNDGALTVTKRGPRSDLDRVDLSKVAASFGPDYVALWGKDTALMVNSNLSAHFPYAGQMWQAAIKQAGIGNVDGVIGIDPTALAALLRVTGPVTLPQGRVVTADNFVDLVTKQIYAEIPNDNAVRDQALQVIAGEVIDAVLSGKGSPTAFVDALGAMAGERRLLLWSAKPDEQAALETTDVGGAIPTADEQPGPYVMAIVNNAGGNKLDAYLERSLRYASDSCEGGQRQATVAFELTNSAPKGLPDVVNGEPLPGLTAGDNRERVSIYLSAGATVSRASLDGQPLTFAPGIERGRPVVSFNVDLKSGQKRSISLETVEPQRSGAVRVDIQPLLLPQATAVAVNGC